MPRATLPPAARPLARLRADSGARHLALVARFAASGKKSAADLDRSALVSAGDPAERGKSAALVALAASVAASGPLAPALRFAEVPPC
jgi:hypothetical protein